MRVMFRVLTVAMLLVSALAVVPAAVGAGDYLSIETAADGNGTVVGDQGLTAGSSLTVYAIERDSEDEFVDNVAADWTLPTKTGGVVDGDLAAAGDNKSATFTGHHVGTAVIHIESGLLVAGDSGTITVNHGAATQMKIENAANGSGTEVDTQTVTAGDTYDQMWAIERDSQGNFVGAVNATWALSSRTEGVVDGDLVPGVTTAAFHGHGVGTAVIHAAYGAFSDETGTFTVVHGAPASLSIESAADNSGSPVGTRSVTAGNALHVYALQRDSEGNFIANVAATWSLPTKTGGVVNGDLVPDGDGKGAIFTGHHVGTAVIHADDGSFTDNTGTITVNHGSAVALTIEDAANGSGSTISTQDLTAGTSLGPVYAIERDSEGNFVDNASATWSMTNTSGGVVTGDLSGTSGTSVSLNGHHVGSGTIHASASGRNAETATITVVHGTANTLAIEDAADGSGSPITAQDLTAGSSLGPVFAIERDAQGNFVDNVSATWSMTNTSGGVVTGDLSGTSGTSVSLNGHLVGTGTIHALASGRNAETATITVVVGLPNQLSIEDAADGSGSTIIAQDLTAGDDLGPVYAIERDGQGNFVDNVSATWSMTNTSGGVVTGDLSGISGTSVSLNGHLVGTGTIQAAANARTAQTATITVVAGTADVLSIETAANGSGSTVTAQDLTAGDSLGPVYAIERDSEGNLVDNVSATWSMTYVTGGVATSDLSGTSGASVTLNAHHVGTGTIHAAANARTAETATITVVADIASALTIETAGDGTGSVVGSPTLSIGVALPLYAVERDAEGNFVANVSVTWSVTGTLLIGDLSATTGATVTFTGSSVTQGTIHAAGAFAADTGTIHVVTGHSPPGPPTDVHVTPAKGRATVSWLAPTYTGGIPLTGFTVTAHAAGHTDGHCSTDGSTLTCVVELLGPVQYSFTVVAKNAEFDSDPSSPAVLATPTAVTVPGVPTGVSGIGQDSRVAVSWTAPSDDGGRAITGYHVSTFVFSPPYEMDPVGNSCDTTTALSCPVTGLTNNTAYKFKVTATNALGPSAPSAESSVVTPVVGSTYFPLTPTRVWTGTLAADTPTPVKVTELSSDPNQNVPSDANAITGFVSVRNPTGLGYVAVMKPSQAPTDHTTQPSISTINFPAHDNRSSGITVSLADDLSGYLTLEYWGPLGTNVEVLLDVTGYFTSGNAGARYLPLTPNRILDSRGTTGNMLGGLTTGVSRSFQVTVSHVTDWNKQVPSYATAVVGTLTVTNQSSPGYFSIGPEQTNPTSALYFPKGDNRASSLDVKLGAGGALWVTYTAPGGPPTARADVVFDVLGYFQATSNAGYVYVPLTSNRILDTRYKNGLSANLTSRTAVAFNVWNRSSDAAKKVPTNAVAVTGTLTVTRQTALGYLTLTNDYNNTKAVKVSQPKTSTMNFPKGDNRATGVTLPLTSSGRLGICYWAAANATTAAIFDVTGYFV